MAISMSTLVINAEVAQFHVPWPKTLLLFLAEQCDMFYWV